jgi:hypothetical protein
MDPRITVAWCKKVDCPIEKVYCLQCSVDVEAHVFAVQYLGLQRIIAEKVSMVYGS